MLFILGITHLLCKKKKTTLVWNYNGIYALKIAVIIEWKGWYWIIDLNIHWLATDKQLRHRVLSILKDGWLSTNNNDVISYNILEKTKLL